MVGLLALAFGFLLICVSIYIIARRQRHGGLAGGAGTVSPPRAPTALGPGRTYTEREVALHTTPDDLWLIINSKVYDFTQYFLLHPGGDAILRNAGRDSTSGFSGSQHPDRVWDMIGEFYIGDLEPSPVTTSKDD